MNIFSNLSSFDIYMAVLAFITVGLVVSAFFAVQQTTPRRFGKRSSASAALPASKKGGE